MTAGCFVWVNGSLYYMVISETEVEMKKIVAGGFLYELMSAIGKDEFLSIISEYCRTHAFGIVSTYDFLSILQERASVDVEYIIDEHIYESIIGVGLG